MQCFYDSCESKFIWKIENFNCLRGESFFSPRIGTTPWHILINRDSSHIFVQLSKWATHFPNYTPSYTVHYYCSFTFIDSNGSPLMCKENTIEWGVGFEKEFTFPNEAAFFPNDILRLECHLWRKVDNPAVPLLFFACTRAQPIANVMKKTFTCVIPEIKESLYNFSESICNGHNLGIKICLPYAGQVSVTLTTDLFGFCAKILVSVLDSSGKRIQFGNHNTKFVSGNRTCHFDINVSRNMLLCHANQCLVLGTLSLIFTCTFTGQFWYDSIVEEIEIFSTPTITNSSAAVSEAETNSNETDNVYNEPEISHTKEPDTASQAFQKLLGEGYLSDFTLKVGDRRFAVHKVILGVRSKVFRAMFDSEMKEMQDNCVDIKDVDEDTLQRMLEFIYSDKIDKVMDSIEASSLYAAADFYALETLKQGCSTILKDGLSTSNALGVLALGDRHQDQQLKSAVLDFISLYDHDIIDTEAWIKFEEENVKLAMETLRKLYARKMRG